MDFTEFLRRLGADPRSGDPELLHARQSDPEFHRAAEEADAFEARLERAVGLPAPENLLDEILNISNEPAITATSRPRWRMMALAASVLIAVGAAGISWNMNRSWDSVDQYLAEHYQHDGDKLLNKSGTSPAMDVQAIFSEFAMEAAPELAGIISLIKYCPTPDGKGIHMVLNTREGPVTLIYMPETDVIDRQSIEFEGMQALLVGLDKGSAAIIGTGAQSISSLYAVVQGSIIPVVNKV
jgi:hypothetical protein